MSLAPRPLVLDAGALIALESCDRLAVALTLPIVLDPKFTTEPSRQRPAQCTVIGRIAQFPTGNDRSIGNVGRPLSQPSSRPAPHESRP